MHVIVRQTCRLCGSDELTQIISLGNQKLASAFFGADDKDCIPVRSVPLELVRCDVQRDENACGLVQLRHTFPPNLIYTNYWYASGVNQTMRDALAEIAEKVENSISLNQGDIILDIGCNDGTLLKSYQQKGLVRIGFDPAENFPSSSDDGFTRVCTYFNKASFVEAVGSSKAKVITSIAMFYDLENPNEFTADIADVLDSEGIWILQMADLPNMIKFNMFDNICHEHLEYYHLAPLEVLFAKHGLKLVDIEKNSVNGSSYRLYICKQEGPDATDEARDRISKIRFEEFNMALDTNEPYTKFKDCIEKNKHDLMFFLNQVKENGKTVFVYGASTKGNVLLQYVGINNSIIPYAADRNPRKWGTQTLGSNIPIISEEKARAMKPDYFLILPYHFLDEMIERESEFLNRGGKFIVPVPEVRLIP